jgi:hypothetical protein
MKKIFAMAAAILFTAGISAFASGSNPGQVPVKQFDYQLSFDRVVIEDDIDLVLEENTNKFLTVNGNDKDIEKLDWQIKKGVLYLKSKKGSLKNKISVRVTVSQLKEIFINDESSVRSTGNLASPKLSVTIKGDGFASIKNLGPIHVSNDSYTDMDIRRLVGDVVLGK